jgi:hypothetical protein
LFQRGDALCYVMKLDCLDGSVDNDSQSMRFIRSKMTVTYRCPDRPDRGEQVLGAVYRRHEDVNGLAFALRPETVKHHP